MKIAIAGAGAMGSRFGLMLKQGGNDVLLIDGWQEHINAIKENGLKAIIMAKKLLLKSQLLIRMRSPLVSNLI